MAGIFGGYGTKCESWNIPSKVGFFSQVEIMKTPMTMNWLIELGSKSGFSISFEIPYHEQPWIEQYLRHDVPPDELYIALSNKALVYYLKYPEVATKNTVLIGGPSVGLVIQSEQNSIQIPSGIENYYNKPSYESVPVIPMPSEVYSKHKLGCIDKGTVQGDMSGYHYCYVMAHSSVPPDSRVMALELVMEEFPLVRILPQYYPFWRCFNAQ